MKKYDIYKNKKLQKEYTIKKFNTWYEEYKIFMNRADLPKIKIIPFSSTDSVMATCVHPENKNETHIINVNQLLCFSHMKNAKSIAYHEFTHILDECTIMPVLPHSEKNAYVVLYSEYHASFVQMCCALEFEKISTIKQISLIENVYDELNTMSVKEYLLYFAKEVPKTIDYYLNFNDVKHMHLAVLHMIYYFAKVDFFEKYCKNNIEEYINLIYFENIFGDKAILFHNLLKECDSTNIEQLVKINMLYLNMCDEYLTNHKSK